MRIPKLRTQLLLSRRSTVLALPALLLLAVASAAALLLVSRAAPNAPAPDSSAWQMTVFVSDGDAAAELFSLSCPEGTGQHPDPTAACLLLSALSPDAPPLSPVPSDDMCTMIYGGPDTATLTGTYRGEGFKVDLSRTDGCQIARWDALVVLLGR